MMETTKTGTKYYVGKREQVPDACGLELRENHKEEFEFQTGNKVVDPAVRE